MPVIRIDYDDEKLKKDEVLSVSNAIQKIVSEVTGIEDVFVYANSSQIKVKIAPIEIFIQMSAHKIVDVDTHGQARGTVFKIQALLDLNPVPVAI